MLDADLVKKLFDNDEFDENKLNISRTDISYRHYSYLLTSFATALRLYKHPLTLTVSNTLVDVLSAHIKSALSNQKLTVEFKPLPPRQVNFHHNRSQIKRTSRIISSTQFLRIYRMQKNSAHTESNKASLNRPAPSKHFKRKRTATEASLTGIAPRRPGF